MTRKNLLFGTLSFVGLVGLVILIFWLNRSEPVAEPVPGEAPILEAEPEPVVITENLGQSVAGRPITITRFGEGETELLFVGGVHGGYEWNSVLLAYEIIDHFKANPELIPEDITVSIIPDLNPDGTYLVTGKTGRFSATDIADPSTRVAEGRFNQNGVDLNRNFDCKWAPESSWRGEVVSAGTAAFSEPEAVALRDYVVKSKPRAVVFWHSKANNVYASECENGIIPDTLTLMEIYAEAADYGQVPVFDAYPITGDAEGWLASIGIPAVTVELETHNSIEWGRNLNGTVATINHFSTAK